MMLSEKKPIPYRACDHIHIEEMESHTFYIDLLHGGSCVLPLNVHRCIESGSFECDDGLEQYLYLMRERLIASKYIEPDLEKIQVGEASVYVPGKKWGLGGQINRTDLEEAIKNEYLKPFFEFKKVNDNQDISRYEYLCERNAIRAAMQGFGIESPLLWMSAGLFAHDVDFFGSGDFSTNFARTIINPASFPVLGSLKNGLDWDVIDNHLEKQLPVLVHVDIYHMPYETNRYYHNRHGAHVITLLEKCEGGYIVLDWAYPSYYYGEISKKELTIARTSENEKDQMSVFNGYPILAAYKLLHLDRFQLTLSTSQYVRSNLHQSLKSMLDDNGIITLFTQVQKSIPNWVRVPEHKGYDNAIQSFFFLDLELKFLLLYYEEMAKSKLCDEFTPDVLAENVVNIRKATDLLKNKLILAMRRKKAIEDEIWEGLFDCVTVQLSKYCETALKILKRRSD
ncbi:MAG: BtrH N-terminal domain-containing protein [Oscillospiraceae bacterium]|nr:BtrH N-terminal domain-containing protein [Oscillospiraceae bacterium]